MTIDRRLHHAARELRAVPIDVPPLGSPRRRPTRVLQALAAPMLFVAGGLFAYGATRATPSPHVHSDVGQVTAAIDAPDTGVSVSAPSASVELAMIAQLVESGRTPARPTVDRPVDEPARPASPTAVGPS